MVGIPREYKILGAIALAAIVLGVLLFMYGGQKPSSKPVAERSDAYTKGNAMARVTVTEFADFQCPACRGAQAIVDQLMTEHPNDIKFTFRHLPLSIHPFAQISAEAAEAAGAQGKFWQMHDVLYEKQQEWGDLNKSLTEAQAKDMFVQYAQNLGLDTNRFRQELDSSAHYSVISADSNAALAAGVNATPTFFVNGLAVDTPSYDALKAAVDQALQQK